MDSWDTPSVDTVAQYHDHQGSSGEPNWPKPSWGWLVIAATVLALAIQVYWRVRG